MGKKAMNTVKARRDGVPIPSHTMKSGARATLGISWKNTMLGYTAARNNFEQDSPMPMPIPRIDATTRPSIASPPVWIEFSRSRGRMRRNLS